MSELIPPPSSDWREAMSVFHREMQEHWDDFSWGARTFEYTKDGFDVRDALLKTKGAWIDMGGPTPYLDCFGMSVREERKVTSINIRKNPYTNSPLKTDVLIEDKGTLPFENGSVGAVFMEGFPPIKLGDVASEVCRVLEPGGFWYTSAAFGENVDILEQFGLEVVKIGNIDDTEPGNRFVVLFQRV